MRHLPANRFVLRTDVKSYYASIDHFLLLDQLAEIIRDKRVLNLLGQYLRRTAERYRPRFCTAWTHRRRSDPSRAEAKASPGSCS